MNAIAKPAALPAPRLAPVLQPQTFDQLVRFAEMVAQSGMVPRDYQGKPANVMVAVQMGSELGLAPMQSLQSIAVINGRPGVWGDGLIGLCRQSHLCEDIQESYEGEGDNRAAICVARRVGSSPVTARFSVADAKKAGLWGKAGPWTQYPERMLRNRARGFALRDAFPDVLRGLKTAEELQDTPFDRDTFRGATVEHVAQPEPQHVARQAPARPRDAVDDDTIPALDDPAPRDRHADAADRVIARVKACATEDDLHDVARDTAISEWRGKIAKSRPELEAAIAAAFGDRYAALTADRAGLDPQA